MVHLVILKYCIVDEDADEIGQLELQFASMNICSAESTTNVESRLRLRCNSYKIFTYSFFYLICYVYF